MGYKWVLPSRTLFKLISCVMLQKATSKNHRFIWFLSSLGARHVSLHSWVAKTSALMRFKMLT